MGKKYIPLQPLGRDPKGLTTPEVQAWLTHDLPNTVLIRSILIAEVRAIRVGHTREIRTMRGLWYEVVKPLLSRAGALHRPKSTSGKPVDWDKELSYRLKEIVDDRITSYEELNIIDGSRRRQPAKEVTAKVIGVNMIGGHYPWVILFIEKDTVWPVIENLATLYGVSAISGGGQPSNACSENVIREIVRSEAYQEAQPEEIVILSLTDYDPAGYIIEGAQIDQVIEAANGIDKSERGKLKRVMPIRIGLEPSQLTQAEIEANTYEPADKGLNEWFTETGGINGQPLGLELDSLPLSRLRSMFAEAIEAQIDITKRQNDLREAFIDLMACNQLLPEFERRRSELIDQAKASQVWEGIKSIPVPTNIFSQAARSGASWIGPNQTLELFSDYQDQLTELWNNQ